MDLALEKIALRRPTPADAILRRGLFFGATFGSAFLGSWLMLEILRANGLNVLELVSLALFFVLFTWITGAFYTAIAGFIVRLRGYDPVILHPSDKLGTRLRRRTAICMPIYNEDTARVAAGIDVIWSSLSREIDQGAFDFFILSDTRKADIAEAEEAAWRTLVSRHDASGRIFYRRRADNVGRKAGNIADFVRSWGGAYDHMVVLDADSIMTGHALVTLARLMETHAEVGVIQTLPVPAGRDTLFARLVQFSARLNGQMLGAGLAFWQLGESNYWGHNAILRMRPFASSCALPLLPGRAPLGGEILSHDFVEAAFMRRAGYEVWLIPDLEGSWEEVPSNIIDFAARDRRWAQGNMQHVNLLPARGLHWISRLHMLTGILSYATSPIWMTVLVVASILTCLDAWRGHQYFEPGAYVLFPTWPESRLAEIASLLAVTLVVLLLPKLLGATLAIVNPRLRKGFGGVRKLLGSLVIEQVFSTLLAPAMMVFHSTFVVSTLAGKPVAWNAQERGDRGLAWNDAFRLHRMQILLGLVWGATILVFAPAFIWWMLPVLAGLLLGPAVTVLTSRASLGRSLRRAGYLMTPEETFKPAELAALETSAPMCPVDLEHPHMEPSPPISALPMEPLSLDYPQLPGAARKLKKYRAQTADL